MRKQLLALALTALVATVGVSALAAGSRVDSARLDGSSEVPPVDTHAHGIATLRWQGDSVHYRLVVGDLTDVTGAHIHMGPPDENGPIVVDLHPATGPGRAAGRIAEGDIDASDFVGPLAGQDLDALRVLVDQGHAYVNVHTSEHTGGEIRGTLQARPEGGSERP